MATEMITLKLESGFLSQIDAVVKNLGYQSRTEFIRSSLREKLEEARLKEAFAALAAMRGKASRKTTDEERRAVREKVAQEFEKKFRQGHRVV